MHICIVIDRPRYRKLPLISDLMQGLSVRHAVTLLDLQSCEEEPTPQADLYLLKSHGPLTLKFAYQLEQQGALVINSWASTLACQDRVIMTQLMNRAGLPWPRTRSCPYLGNLAADTQALAALSFPLVIKSRNSNDDELIEKVYDVEQLQNLALNWPLEAVILQEWLCGDGWDTKVWVIDGHMFAAKQRSPLEHRPKDQFQLLPEQIDSRIREIALEAGRVFSLSIYGVDFTTTEQGPVAVDVNSFPGMRNLVGPDKELIALVDRLEPTMTTRQRPQQRLEAAYYCL
jgi:ribosomal protein S6--L-glutamate ligase